MDGDLSLAWRQQPSQTRWDFHFLKMALHCASQSRDPATRVGAVIVGPNQEVRSTGFNGLPRGVADTPERLNDRVIKLQLIVHAEVNCVAAAARLGVPTEGCSLYLAATDDSGIDPWGGPPCSGCTSVAIQAGIQRVVSFPAKQVSKWKENLALSREMLLEAGVEFLELPWF